ncbi:MAG: outer membrane protein assembly factor BamD, partial [Gammaproteobacteria bacterium HGW-Gammaproteobacteria-7]
MTLTFNRLLVLALLSLLLAGCGLFGGRQDPLETLPVEEMYAEAKDALMAGNYSRAGRYYSRLVSRFPFGEFTEQAFLDLAYAQFKGGNTAEATSTLNRFIRTYPTHRHIDYAYYLKALINFSRENIFLERF